MSYITEQRAEPGLPLYDLHFQPLRKVRPPHPTELRSARRVSEAPHAHLFMKNPEPTRAAEQTHAHSPRDTDSEVEEIDTPKPREKAPIPPPRGPTAWETFWEWNFPEEGGAMSWVMTALHISTLGIVLALAWGICSLIDYCNEPSKPVNAAPIPPDNLIDLQDDN